jgi:uroporphyrinogen decarboxylase
MRKDILFKTLKHESTERRPWVVFSGVHVGKLLGYDAKEVYQDEEKLYTSLIEANKLYEPDGLPVIFDLQVEAEILGCDLMWAKDSPPTVKSHPLMFDKKIPCRCNLPTEVDGRLPMILSVMKRLKNEIGNETALYGLITGPFTLASHLRGTTIFMDMFDDEDYVVELIKFATDCAIRMADLYIDAGMDIIAAVDPLVSQISPSHFKTFLKEEYSRLFENIR